MMDINTIKQGIEQTAQLRSGPAPDRRGFATQVHFPIRTHRKTIKGLLGSTKHFLVNIPAVGTVVRWAITILRVHVRVKQSDQRFVINEARMERDFLVHFERFRSLEHHLNLARQEIADLRSALAQRPPSLPASNAPQAVEAGQDANLRGLYLNFEKKFRASSADILAGFSYYDSELLRVPSALKSLPAVDIGCGRGEWLKYLRTKGFNPVGVDSNEAMAGAATAEGLNAVVADGISYLRELPGAGCSVVSAFHVVEHMPLGALLQLLEESFRVLAQGGIAIFETPNPENILVGACNFYTDPTHKNPLPPHTLDFLVLQCGFSKTTVLRKGKPTTSLTSNDPAVQYMLQWFTKEQDYAIIAYKS